MMEQSLYELLQQCTVRVSVPKRGQGSGFFVAPGLVLTCAHVVVEAQKQNLEVNVTWWKGSQSIEEQVISAQIKEFRAPPYPDLALLQVNLTDHPCVSLGEAAQPFDRFYGYGCSADYPNGDSVTLDCEGWTDGLRPLLKLKQGQLRSGFSGAPLLNIRTERVCGLVKLSRDQETDLGGRAVPTKIVLQEFPQLVGLQQALHHAHEDWSEGTTGGLEVFYSYTDQDNDLRQQLDNHLSLLRRQKLISRWYNRNVEVGGVFEPEIKMRLNTAHIILLLVSPSFMASDYCYDQEMRRAMERHEAGNACVIPVILRPTDWAGAPFGKLQALPGQGKAITTWPNQDEAFLAVAQGIRKAVEQWKKTTG